LPRRRLCSLARPRPPRSTRLPYTTLFRSGRFVRRRRRAGPGKRGGVRNGAGCRAVSGRRSGGGRRRGRGRSAGHGPGRGGALGGDRKSTRLNSSHVKISYAVFCLKKKTET